MPVWPVTDRILSEVESLLEAPCNCCHIEGHSPECDRVGAEVLRARLGQALASDHVEDGATAMSPKQ